ncbi:MAG: lipid II flippase MurJ [Limnochordia bacterium]
MFLIFVSRLLGFVRLRAASEVFGRTWHTDAFNAAFVIPDLMYYLLVGGALSSAFIPVFTSYLAKGRRGRGVEPGQQLPQPDLPCALWPFPSWAWPSVPSWHPWWHTVSLESSGSS